MTALELVMWIPAPSPLLPFVMVKPVSVESELDGGLVGPTRQKQVPQLGRRPDSFERFVRGSGVGVGLGRGLPDDIRSQLKTILDEVTATRNAESTRVNEEAKQAIIAAGGVVRTLEPEQRAKWVKVMKPVWGKFEDDIGADLIAAAQAANAMN